MMTFRSASLHLLLSLLVSSPLTLRGDDIRMQMPAAGSAQRIGGGSLNDLNGVAHTRLNLAGGVGVVIFSIPDMSQGPSQRRWSKILADDPETRLPGKVALVLVENMAQAGPFKDEARDDMKDQFQQKKRPFLLLDETGGTFKRFAIPRDKTEILIFDKKGTLRDVEADLGDQDVTIKRIKAIIEQLGSRS